MIPIVRMQGVTKRFGDLSVLSALDFELEAGSTTVLLGQNGAGKSTLLRLLLGVERPDSGVIRVAGLDPLRSASEVRAHIGFVPDRPDVYGWMTPRELFAFLRPQYPRWSRALEQRLVARFEVPLHTSFARLSRGEAAKAMIVAALAPEPELYLLDEAFSGLDPLVRDEVLAGFLEELELEGRAALVVTHELDVAARLADRVAILAGGRIALCADLEDGDRPRRLKALITAAQLEGSVAR